MTALTHLLHVKDLLFEPGDRMGREEFLSRWERMPELKFAELIDGVVYVPSPTSAGHSRKHGVLLAWTAVYAGRAAFVEILPEATWFMEESAPQPDVALRIKPGFGGQSRDAGKYVAGAPEFVAEVARAGRTIWDRSWNYTSGQEYANTSPSCSRNVAWSGGCCVAARSR